MQFLGGGGGMGALHKGKEDFFILIFLFFYFVAFLFLISSVLMLSLIVGWFLFGLYTAGFFQHGNKKS